LQDLTPRPSYRQLGARPEGRSLRRGRRGRVALATCAEIPNGDEDFPALIHALDTCEIEAEPAVWDGDVDWSSFDLVVLRSTWDYAERCEEFLTWARALPRVLNPVPVLDWNTDKQRYLSDLGAAGVPIVRTLFVEPGQPLDPPANPFVVKPAVSAGGRSSAWFEPDQVTAAGELVARIHADGRAAMVQPFVRDTEEVALVYIGGAYSHAVGRVVPLPGGREHAVFFLDEELTPSTATPEQRTLAEAALACAPADLLYARVDLLGGAVLELELAEPSLYLGFAEDAAERLAVAISLRLER
jgi:glutathione synthase/RimK-type ligase-like ATP-grasp enzyme